MLSTPLDTHSKCASPLGSVDGYALQIDELKGTKPVKKIDLSGKGLGVASAIIIASCIKENGVLKELKYAAARVFASMSAPVDTRLLSHCPHPPLADSRIMTSESRAPVRSLLSSIAVVPPNAPAGSAQSVATSM